MELVVGDKIEDIYFASEEHKNETLLTLSYEDKGEIIILENGLEFIGKKMNVKMTNIQDILLLTESNRSIGQWVQVKYKSDLNVLKTANFLILCDEVLMGKEKDNSAEFFQSLICLKSSWDC